MNGGKKSILPNSIGSSLFSVSPLSKNSRLGMNNNTNIQDIPSLSIRLNSLVTRLPVGGTDLTVLSNELEGLDQSQNFIDVSANREVVDGHLVDLALRIDDEETTKGDTSLLVDGREEERDTGTKTPYLEAISLVISLTIGIFM